MVLALGASGCGVLDALPEKEQSPTPTATQTQGTERPAIGAGDPMLGVTDGVERPELSEIPTAELEPTNALETAERFRRVFEDETMPVDQWATELGGVSDPTFAASLAQAQRGYFTMKQTATVEVVEGYKLDNPQPYARIAAVDADGKEAWNMRLAFKPTKADPSVGDWKVISVDWVDKALSDSKTIPLTESGREDVRVTATVASSVTLAQGKGETPEAREATLRTVMLDPVHAIGRGKPVPDQDVTVQAVEPTSTYLVTPEGSSVVWVEVNGGYQAVGDDGTVGDVQPVTIYVQMANDGSGYVAQDVMTGDEYKAATGAQ